MEVKVSVDEQGRLLSFNLSNLHEYEVIEDCGHDVTTRKTVVVHTGARVIVPGCIKKGDKILINLFSFEYSSPGLAA